MYPEMITIEEASRRTGVPRDCVRKLCIENKIANFKTGKKYLVNWQKFCDFLNNEEEEKENAREKKVAEKLADDIWLFIQAKVREEMMKQAQMKLAE